MNRKEIASLGGKARAAKLTSEERSESARRAVRTRWAKRFKGISFSWWTGCPNMQAYTIWVQVL